MPIRVYLNSSEDTSVDLPQTMECNFLYAKVRKGHDFLNHFFGMPDYLCSEKPTSRHSLKSKRTSFLAVIWSRLSIDPRKQKQSHLSISTSTTNAN